MKKVTRKSNYHWKELYPQGFRAYQPKIKLSQCMCRLCGLSSAVVAWALQLPQQLHVWLEKGSKPGCEQLLFVIFTMLKWLMNTKEIFSAVFVNAKSKAVK